MKEDLIELGFVDDPVNNIFLKYVGNKFSFFANINQSYLYVEMDSGGDRENIFFPYLGKERLANLIKSFEDYFK